MRSIIWGLELNTSKGFDRHKKLNSCKVECLMNSLTVLLISSDMQFNGNTRIKYSILKLKRPLPEGIHKISMAALRILLT